MTFKIDEFTVKVDPRGKLVAIDFAELPFIPQRLFFVYELAMNKTRGNHAHFLSKQYHYVIKGYVKVTLHDGKKEYIYNLKSGQGLYVPELIWNTFEGVVSDSVMIVFASDSYDPNDYITDFEYFKKLKN
jgi:dTDP-4-dehydrorhamnose 3,5-epimerase-like enzyme